jgi:hypothetical protein
MKTSIKSGITSSCLAYYRLRNFLSLGVAMLGLIVPSAFGQWVVNYDFNWTNNATYSGTGVLGTGTFWNSLSVPASFAYPAITYTNSGGMSDDGVTNRGVVLTISTYTSYGSGGVNALLDDWVTAYSWEAARPFMLTNLPSGVYNLVCYAACGTFANRRTTFTVNGVSQTCTNTLGVADTSFVQNDNYVQFSTFIVTNGGIAGTCTAAPGSPNQEGVFNGLQLQYLGANAAPTVSATSPSSQTKPQSTPAQFSATATGYPLPAYRWQFSSNNVTWQNVNNGGTVSGATSNVLTLASVQPSQAGYYQLVVSNSAGSATSSPPSQLIVNPSLPSTWTANFDFDNYAGGFVGTYSGAGVVGSGTYWNSIDGGGTYNGGTFTSAGGILDDGATDAGISATVTAAGAYSSNPANNALLDDYAFQTSGTGSFAFNNLPNGVYTLVLFGVNGGYATNLTSGTTFTVNGYSLSNSNTTDASFVQGDNYVVFTNIVVQGGTLSGTFAPALGKTEGNFNGAQLRFEGTNAFAPIILVQPTSQTNYQNFPAKLTVVATGNPTPSYQWQSGPVGGPFVNVANGSNVSGAQSASLSITNLAATTSYRVVITNSAGAVTSSVVTVTVNALATPWTVNFDFLNAVAGGIQATNVYAGYGVLGTNITHNWNGIYGPVNPTNYPRGTWYSYSGFADDGVNNTSVRCTVTGYAYAHTNAPNGLRDLMDNYAACYGTESIVFTNLADGYYHLVLFSVNGGYHSDITSFVFGGQTLTVTNTTDTTFVQGDNYVMFTNLLVQGGTLSGTYANVSAEGAFCGAQLQYAGTTPQAPLIYVATPATPTLSIQNIAGGFVLQWSVGTLQTNADLSNPSGWGVVTGATSPFTNSTPNLPQLFYRASNP